MALGSMLTSREGSMRVRNGGRAILQVACTFCLDWVMD